MGCDIHPWVEVLDDSGNWRPILEPPGRQKQEWQRDYELEYEWDFGRNYMLFALLAGVRNNGQVTPLLEVLRIQDLSPEAQEAIERVADRVGGARGIPTDASPEYREAAEDRDYHSHSYFTLEELRRFDWSKPAPLREEGTWAVSCEQWMELMEFADRLHPDPARVRVVFHFDS